VVNLWYQSNKNIAGTGGLFFREAVSAHLPVFQRPVTPPFPPFPSAPLRQYCTARRGAQKKTSCPRLLRAKAKIDGLLSAAKIRRISEAEGHRCKVLRHGLCPPSRRSRVAHLKSCSTWSWYAAPPPPSDPASPMDSRDATATLRATFAPKPKPTDVHRESMICTGPVFYQGRGLRGESLRAED